MYFPRCVQGLFSDETLAGDSDEGAVGKFTNNSDDGLARDIDDDNDTLEYFIAKKSFNP